MKQGNRTVVIWIVVAVIVVAGGVGLFFGVRGENEKSSRASELQVDSCRAAVIDELGTSSFFAGDSDGTKVTGVAGDSSKNYDVECTADGDITSITPK